MAEPKARSSDVSFRTLHRECGTPIKQKRWCPLHEREIGADEIVKGWEVAKGQFVIVEDADLEALETADETRIRLVVLPEQTLDCGTGPVDPGAQRMRVVGHERERLQQRFVAVVEAPRRRQSTS